MPNQLHFLLQKVKTLWMEEKQQMSYHSSSKVFNTGSCAFPRRTLEKHGLDENATGTWKAEPFPLSKGSPQGRKLLNVCMNDPEKQTEFVLIMKSMKGHQGTKVVTISMKFKETLAGFREGQEKKKKLRAIFLGQVIVYGQE